MTRHAAPSRPFRPAWWLRNAHAQTLWPTLFRHGPATALRRERMHLPDGDFVDLDWAGPPGGPRVLVLHGLEGSSRSSYARGLLAALAAAGYQAVLMHFRGCSGSPNHQLRRYHAGDTGDLAFVARQLLARTPASPLFAVGFSLGGNALLKWLGETGAANTLTAAAAVSVPFDLAAVAERLNCGLSRIYRRYLVRKLIAGTLDKTCNPGFPISAERLRRLSTMRAYDQAVTAPLHGFRDADDYYARASCGPYLKHIAIPTLVLHAWDDPFMNPAIVPGQQQISSSVVLEVSAQGGHVGFIAGSPWRPRYWLDERLIAWLAEHRAAIAPEGQNPPTQLRVAS